MERFPTMKLVVGQLVYDFEGDRQVEDLKVGGVWSWTPNYPKIWVKFKPCLTDSQHSCLFHSAKMQ